MSNPNMFCRPNIVLPSIYSEALSFYETVCLIAQRVEDVKNLVDQYEQNYKDYTDGKIAEIDSKVTEQLNDTIYRLRNDYIAFQNIVNNNLVIFGDKLNALDNKIDNSLIGVRDTIDIAIEQNNEILFEELSKGLIDLKVINYFTGQSVTVQSMFDYLAQFHLENSLTYNALANKNKTYNELIALNITYTVLAVNGGQLIP